MSRKKKREGNCHICGTFGPLSFEHIPPRAAFNDRPIFGFSGDVLMEHGLNPDRKHGTMYQRGAGGYTLCDRCNNKTGSWYGPKFVEWCYQGMQILERSKGKPTLIYMNYLFPLAILKQIVTMFFSVNTAEFRLAQPYLVDFVLDRERKYLPPDIRFYTYYTLGSKTRSVGVAGQIKLGSSQINVMSEIAFPPFGYLMTFGDTIADSRVVEITRFARYNYGEFEVLSIQLPILETHTPFPGDYRTLAEIREQGTLP